MRYILNKKNAIKILSVTISVIMLTIVLTLFINTLFRHEEPLVYITKTGDRYHSSSCGYLYASSIPRGLYQVKNEGYVACYRCGGKSNETIIINNYGASFAISFLIGSSLVFFIITIYNKMNDYTENQNE